MRSSLAGERPAIDFLHRVHADDSYRLLGTIAVHW
jgi:hypothetical protein